MKAGYATVRPLPAVTDEQFEAMVAGRNLLLVNDVIEQPNADTQAMTPAYVAARPRAGFGTGSIPAGTAAPCLMASNRPSPYNNCITPCR